MQYKRKFRVDKDLFMGDGRKAFTKGIKYLGDFTEQGIIIDKNDFGEEHKISKDIHFNTAGKVDWTDNFTIIL